jgi:hypothetical protein
MSRSIVLVLVTVLALSSLYLAPLTLRPVNAASSTTGEVCLGTAPTSAPPNTGCPLAPPLFNSTTFPSPQLRVPVFINNSQPLNVFEVTLQTNHTLLKPAGVDLTGSLLFGGTVLVECLGGRLVIGSSCSSTDTVDTLHYSVSGAVTSQVPTSGLLFTAMYNVSQTVKTTVTSIGFATGCTSTSVPLGVCVTVGGLGGSLSETVQGAKYSNNIYFDFQPNANSLTVNQGETTTPGFFYLNVTSINDFAGTVTISTIVNSTVPTVTLSLNTTRTTTSTISLAVSLASPQNISYVTVHVPPTTTPGTYNITFVATTDSLPPNILYIPLIVPKPDFEMVANPANIIFNVTLTKTSNITISSLGNFSGPVTLTYTASPGLEATLSATSFNINITSPAKTTLKANATFAGKYEVNITGTSGPLPPHTITVVFLPVDFAMSVPQGAVVIPVKQSGLEPITVGLATGTALNVTIHLTNIYIDQVTASGGSSGPSPGPLPGISVSCTGPDRTNPSQLMLYKNSSEEQPVTLLNCQVSTQVVGNFTVTVAAQSPYITHTVTFPVQVIGPDFTIAALPAVQTLPQGKSVTFTIVFSRLLNLNDTINPVTLNIVNGTAVGANGGFPLLAATQYAFSSSTVFLNASSTSPTITLTVTANDTMPLGPYSLVIKALGKVSLMTHYVTCTVVVASTTSQVSLQVNSVTPSTYSGTIGSTISVAINVQNTGKITTTSTVALLIGDQTVDQQNVTLTPGQNQTVTLHWNTGQFSAGSYVIGGEILAVSGQANPNNNLNRASQTFTLNSSNSSVVSSPYFLPAIIIGIIVIIAVVLVLFLQARRRTKTVA